MTIEGLLFLGLAAVLALVLDAVACRWEDAVN